MRDTSNTVIGVSRGYSTAISLVLRGVGKGSGGRGLDRGVGMFSLAFSGAFLLPFGPNARIRFTLQAISVSEQVASSAVYRYLLPLPFSSRLTPSLVS